MEQKEKQRLVNKGRQAPISAVLEQGRGHVLLARAHEGDLQEAGWVPEETVALDTGIGELDALFSTHSSSVNEALGATRSEVECRREAKALIRKLRLAVPVVLRKNRIEGINKASFNAGESLGKSTPKISEYLMKIRPFVKTMDELLKPRFGGKSPSEMLETVKAALDATDASQENLLAGLPEETVRIYLMAGRILDQIEELNVAGKIAFDGEAEIAAKFNKDLILRATRGGGKDKPPAAPQE